MDDALGAAGASDEMCVLSEYIGTALDRVLPPDVLGKARFHLLDTIAAMVSGARLHVGRMALSYIRSLGGRSEAIVVGTSFLTTAIDAALANGMLAHADETDDSHAPSISHPGCAVVPAALAMAERTGRSGDDLLRAVVLGYDILTRVNMALGARQLFDRGFGPYSIGGAWGAAAAAGSLARIAVADVPHLLSNIAQQTSGIATWMRDEEHVEKALHFGGMPARNGVAAATMAAHGFRGVPDVLTGPGNFLDTYSARPDRSALTRGLGTEFEIVRTSIKKWSVGSPIQAALDSLEFLMREHGLTADDVAAMSVHLPTKAAYVVADRSVPDINCPHCLAVMLVDGAFGFASSHDYARLADPRVAAVRRRITLIPSDELEQARPVRQAIVEVTRRDGSRLSHRTIAVRGVPENPMNEADIRHKAADLLGTAMGGGGAARLIDTILSIERMADIRELRPLLMEPEG